MEEYNAKLKVFQAFCAKFEEAAKQFTTRLEREFAQKFADSFLDSWNQSLTDAKSAPVPTYSTVAASPSAASNPLPHQHPRQQTTPHLHRQPAPFTPIAPPREDLRVFIRLEAGAPARAQKSYAIRTHISRKLRVDSRKIPQVFQVKSGWAVLTTDITTRDLLVQRQTEWTNDLGAVVVEVNKKWFTYIVPDYPRKLTDLYGNEVDSDTAVNEEIEAQTGLKPFDVRPSQRNSDNPLTKTVLVSFLEPTKKYWCLFDSRPATLINKTKPLKQCDICWDFHPTRVCHRRALCKNCGKPNHGFQACNAPPQCANRSGTHAANFTECPVRPKKVHGVFRRLTKEQREYVRTVGAETYRQRNSEPQQRTLEPQHENAEPQGRSSPRVLSPAASRAPSCITVATAPEAEEEPEHPRPGSPRKRRIVLITRPNEHE